MDSCFALFVDSLAGVTYLRYTVLMSSNKSETAVHYCDPALSVLVMLVSRNVFHVVSALQSFASVSYLLELKFFGDCDDFYIGKRSVDYIRFQSFSLAFKPSCIISNRHF